AEDGIRDFHVTGVQTCALPIYRQLGLPAEQLLRPPGGRVAADDVARPRRTLDDLEVALADDLGERRDQLADRRAGARADVEHDVGLLRRAPPAELPETGHVRLREVPPVAVVADRP